MGPAERKLENAIALLKGTGNSLPERMGEAYTQRARAAAIVGDHARAQMTRDAAPKPASTAMVGRYYWYSHAKAGRIGYHPAPARDALIETISWLAASRQTSVA